MRPCKEDVAAGLSTFDVSVLTALARQGSRVATTLTGCIQGFGRRQGDLAIREPAGCNS